MPFGSLTSGDILGYLFLGDPFAPSVTGGAEIALWFDSPGNLWLDGTELNADSYERVVTASGDWAFSAGIMVNTSVITFPEALEDWAVAPNYATYVVVGTLPAALGHGFYGELTNEKEIPAGSIPRFDVGDLTIALIYDL